MCLPSKRAIQYIFEYKENISFNESSFNLKIHYADGSSESVGSGFTFALYKIDNTETLVTGALNPGSYKIHVVYNDA